MFREGGDIVRLLCLWLVLSQVAASADNPEPSILDTSPDIHGLNGSEVVLPCSIRNLGSRMVVWRKGESTHLISIGDVVFSADRNYSVETHVDGDRTDVNLRISYLQMDDAGLYECRVSSTSQALTKVVELVVMDNPEPSILDTSPDIHGLNGSEVVLPCSIRNLGSRMVVWRKGESTHPISIGDVVFSADRNYSVETHVDGDRTDVNLRISYLQMDDAGLYECQVSSTSQALTKVVELVVMDNPEPSILDTSPDIHGLNGSEVVLPCSIRNLGSRMVVWRKGESTHPISIGDVVFSADRNYSVETHVDGDRTDVNLRISYLQMDDAGLYECRVSSTSQALTKVVELVVMDNPEPSILDTSPDIHGLNGSEVVLPCSIRNLGSRMVVWRKGESTHPISIGDVVFSADRNYSVETHVDGDRTDVNLRISYLQMDDAGLYECRVSSTSQALTKVVELVVMDNPEPSILDMSPDIHGLNGSEVVLPCSIRNLGSRMVIWRKGESTQPISIGDVVFFEDRKYSVETHVDGDRTDVSLRISYLQMDDAGLYECRVSSTSQALTKVVELVVMENPNHPRLQDESTT